MKSFVAGTGGRSAVVLCLSLVFVAMSGCDGEPTPDDARPVVMTVSPEPSRLEPGGVITLLWRFRLADHWHLYWPGRNDSGFAPRIELEMPSGWVAGGAQWPVPERLVSAGDIVDHVYHDELVVLQRLGAPNDVRPGDKATIRAQVRWLACKDSCVPGQADVDFTLSVVERANEPPSPHVAQAKRNLPRPLPPDLMRTYWRGATFHLALAQPTAAEPVDLTFMPTTDCGELVDLIADGTGRELALRFVPREGTVGPVRGLLLLKKTAGPAAVHHLDMPAVIVNPIDLGG